MFRKYTFIKVGLAVALIAFSQVLYSQGSWESIVAPTMVDLNSVYFTDSLYGWVVGDSGVILHTKDGGDSWSSQQSYTSNEIATVFFLNRNLGWASSFQYDETPYGTDLLKTTDGGQNWSLTAYPEDNLFMNCILYLDSLNGWMGGSPHAIVRTMDGGATWSQAEVDTSTLAFFPVLNIKFYDQQYGYASGGIFDIAGVTWHTHNGGEKWYAINPSDAPADEVHGLHLFDSITAMGSGGDPDFGYGVGMLRTENGGEDWNYEELGIQGIAYDIDFRNETEAWSPLGHRRKMIYSLDAMKSWTEIDTPDSTAIYDMIFTDSLHGFAAGRDGAVLKYKPPVPVSVRNHPYSMSSHVILHPNSPNPFSSKTVTNFEVIENPTGANAKEIDIKIQVLNRFGKEVALLMDKTISPGKYQLTFDGTNLSSGIYYLRLTGIIDGGESIVLNSKMMLIDQ